MDCKEAKRYMPKYMEEGLDKDTEKELEGHLEKCDECAELYEVQKLMDNELKEAIREKELPEGYEKDFWEGMPIQSKRGVLKKFSSKKWLIALAAAAAAILFIIMPRGNKPPSKDASKVANKGSFATASWATQFIGIHGVSYDITAGVVTDERIIGNEIGTVNEELNYETDTVIEGVSSNILPLGTNIYTVKGTDGKDLVAAKHNGSWLLFRRNGFFSPVEPLYIEDYLNAEKIVVSYNLGKGDIKREITDRNAVKKIAECLKQSKGQIESPWYTDSDKVPFYDGFNHASFYFYNEDGEGIGKIAKGISTVFTDPSFGGYIVRYEDDHTYYKVPGEVMKLLVPDSVKNGYDSALGGVRQVYEVYLGKRMMLRTYVEDEKVPAPEAKLIKKGEKLIMDGRATEDNLAGNFKLMITMKGTTIQETAKEQLRTEFGEIPGAVSCEVTEGDDKDATIIYIGFNTEPLYLIEENLDMIIMSVD